MTHYFRPVLRHDNARPGTALTLADGWTWFDTVELRQRDASPVMIPVSEVPSETLDRLTSQRAPICGLDFAAPRLMGILNVTPDSFSDGGEHYAHDVALQHARDMADQGAAIVDVGGESTRPGATEVPAREETARVIPVIRQIRKDGRVPVSIDTRKATVACAAHDAGAGLVNDVAGFSFDKELAPLCAEKNLPVCIMHAQGDPQTMQVDPRYDDVVLDVYDFLAERVNALIGIGIERHRIIVDPGIGFGKTQEHNLTLLRNMSIFHGLGCALLLGASRKRFIADIGKAPQPSDRVSGSVAVALAGVMQGVQILRVHDVKATRSALDLWSAIHRGQADKADVSPSHGGRTNA